ncbi:MAG: pyridoxamine 5'-phosphate oxidase family protein [Faecalibacterium sp.]|nr:pyridoxamine 5'-phosphate oxidase family protein [Ruminococcus flavefaciens]MCM1392035.1 pyridoxamine 5'-phosphate oxidase family protein [Ruminococcus sp.]MCM1484842.1 pyridoxamine 5'-phosphate oxidase family protein [Faecalibacterium sp.]
MRKSNREVKDFEKIVSFLDSCDTVRIALFDDDYPYIVPISFGYEVIGGKIVIYFHGAKVGKKQQLIAKNNKVCVEADTMNGYVNLEHGGVTTDFQSIIGFGEVACCEGEEKIKGLDLLMKHCGYDGFSADDGCAIFEHTDVSKIVLDVVTCKKRF